MDNVRLEIPIYPVIRMFTGDTPDMAEAVKTVTIMSTDESARDFSEVLYAIIATMDKFLRPNVASVIVGMRHFKAIYAEMLRQSEQTGQVGEQAKKWLQGSKNTFAYPGGVCRLILLPGLTDPVAVQEPLDEFINYHRRP